MYYRISFNTWLTATRKHHAMLSSRQNYFKEEMKAQDGRCEVLIEVEEIIEVSSEEEKDDNDLGLRDIQKNLNKVPSSERFRKQRSSLNRVDTMGKRKLSHPDSLDNNTSQKKKSRRQSMRNDIGSSLRVTTPNAS